MKFSPRAFRQRIEPRPVTIIRIASDIFEISTDDIQGTNREKRFVWPRHAAMLAVKTICPDLSLPQIGEWFMRDHTTVIHALKYIADKQLKDPIFNKKVEALIEASREIVRPTFQHNAQRPKFKSVRTAV